ncbi:hypothetical protein OMR07_24990, partial [Methylobacterium organophilum]|nr:hypothetical protein [Methylobacterium organophilum]
MAADAAALALVDATDAVDRRHVRAAARQRAGARPTAAAERLKLKFLGPMLKGTADLIEDAEKNGLRGNEGEQALRNQ